MQEPTCKEIDCHVSWGATVQIVKYEYSARFQYAMGRKYDIPEDWTEQDVRDFQQDKTITLRENLEGIAQGEMDELTKQRDEA